MHGVMEASGSLDTLGILSRSVEDIALYRDVLLGIPPKPIADIERPPRIGLCRTHVWEQVEPTTRALIEDAAERLARAGAAVSDLALPASFARLNEAHRVISSFEFARTFTLEIENHWDGSAKPCVAAGSMMASAAASTIISPPRPWRTTAGDRWIRYSTPMISCC